MCHNNYPSKKQEENELTVFVGGLHGTMTAYGLFCVMSELFGQVSYSGIDFDGYKYPIGELIFLNTLVMQISTQLYE